MSNPLALQDFSALQKPQYGLTVGMPTLGSHRTEFTLALMQCGFPINTIGQYIPILGHKVGEARNMIAHIAKSTHSKYLLFVDEDVLPPANAFRKLVWDLDNNPHISVVAGIYATKDDPPAPLIFDAPGVGPSYDWHRGDFRKVYAVGMGCTIIRVADLEKLDAVCGRTKIDDFPAIGFNTEVVEYFKDGTAWIKDDSLPTKGWSMTFTEDMYFCMKCHDLGMNVYAETSVQCGHIDRTGKVYTMDAVRPNEPRAREGDPLYFDLGSGEFHRYWVDNKPMFRVDLDKDLKPDFIQDVRDLDFKDNLADGLAAIHVLEHMSRHDAETMLDEMVRVLKPGCSLVIGTPDMKAVCKYYLDQGHLNDMVLRSVYGWQVNEFQYHKSGWDVETLSAALVKRGCTVTQVIEDPNLLVLTIWARKNGGEEPAPEGVPVAVTEPQHDFAEPQEAATEEAQVIKIDTGDIQDEVPAS